jgi:hypothetical protein
LFGRGGRQFIHSLPQRRLRGLKLRQLRLNLAKLGKNVISISLRHRARSEKAHESERRHDYGEKEFAPHIGLLF